MFIEPNVILPQELTTYQQAHKIAKMPSLLEWLSFIFASGNLLAGPYFELSDYLNFIERKGPWDPKSKQPTAANQYMAGVRPHAILSAPRPYLYSLHGCVCTNMCC